MTLIDKAEPHDDDLIRRKDALAAVQGFEYGWHAEDVIAALPAALSRCPYGASGDDCCGGYCSMDDDKKGGDACDKDDDPANARPATSPGVTAGANPLPPDPAAIREAALREAAALCFKNADGITEAVSAFPQIKKRRVLLQRAEQSKVDAAAIFGLIPTKGAADDR